MEKFTINITKILPLHSKISESNTNIVYHSAKISELFGMTLKIFLLIEAPQGFLFWRCFESFEQFLCLIRVWFFCLFSLLSSILFSPFSKYVVCNHQHKAIHISENKYSFSDVFHNFIKESPFFRAKWNKSKRNSMLLLTLSPSIFTELWVIAPFYEA